jgi:hypothetical protein
MGAFHSPSGELENRRYNSIRGLMAEQVVARNPITDEPEISLCTYWFSEIAAL